MNPIYKFELSDGNTTQRAFPIYGNDLAKDFEKESGQEFFRAKLSGNLTFESEDYTFIDSGAFDTQFILEIFISYDAGQTWASYWRGTFWKTDCEFDGNAQAVKVRPTVLDKYNDVLAGIEKEFNLIPLAPVIQELQLDKRPCLQIYVEGNNSVGQIIFGNNTYWETECGQPNNILDYHFGVMAYLYPVQFGFYDTYPPVQTQVFYSLSPVLDHSTINYGEYILEIVPVTDAFDIKLTRVSDNAQWRDPAALSYSSAVLTAVPGTPANYQYVEFTTLNGVYIYGRIITDVATAWEIPANDIVANNRNYRYCMPFDSPDHDSTLVVLTGNKTATPTPYGIYQPGIYYDVPDSTGHWVPIAQNSWDEKSIWLDMDEFATLNVSMAPYLATVTLKDAFPLWSVISVLLAQIAPGITHLGMPGYSAFLYGQNPILGFVQNLYITPKSNLVTFGYDNPAQQAPVTLKSILDMLRDCFRCYWFIDDQNRFRIEHISYFMNGGAYPGTPDYPQIGIDLTKLTVTRNGKPWSFGRNQYQFEKPNMAARYQFGWMDNVTELFDGYPIDILAKYVNPENIEQIDISHFTSDVDYILLNPSEISKDGFVLFATGAISQLGQLGYAQGDLSNYSGDPYEPIPASNRIYSPLFQIGEGVTQIQIDSYNAPGYGYDIVFYNANQRLIARSYHTGNATIQVSMYGLTAKYMAVVLRKTDNSNIVPNEAANVHANIFGMVQPEKLPYYEFIVDGVSHILQNAWAAFIFLQRYYLYDMPAWNVAINGVQQTVQGIKKLKIQNIKFPVMAEPDLSKLIKTELGNGVIQKMSVNLPSRNAHTTLKYDTE